MLKQVFLNSKVKRKFQNIKFWLWRHLTHNNYVPNRYWYLNSKNIRKFLKLEYSFLTPNQMANGSNAIFFFTLDDSRSFLKVRTNQELITYYFKAYNFPFKAKR
jgi:hypothetical protein